MAGFQEKDCVYVTVFKDRSDVAWGTFIWYASEPENFIFLRDGKEAVKKISVGEILRCYSRGASSDCQKYPARYKHEVYYFY